MSQRQVCSKESPMPQKAPGQWQHVDAHETDYDGDYSIEYYCPNCHLTFRTEMPD